MNKTIDENHRKTIGKKIYGWQRFALCLLLFTVLGYVLQVKKLKISTVKDIVAIKTMRDKCKIIENNRYNRYFFSVIYSCKCSVHCATTFQNGVHQWYTFALPAVWQLKIEDFLYKQDIFCSLRTKNHTVYFSVIIILYCAISLYFSSMSLTAAALLLSRVEILN